MFLAKIFQGQSLGSPTVTFPGRVSLFSQQAGRCSSFFFAPPFVASLNLFNNLLVIFYAGIVRKSNAWRTAVAGYPQPLNLLNNFLPHISRLIVRTSEAQMVRQLQRVGGVAIQFIEIT
ncbi:MAG: hypothetical protein LBH14_01690 [Desulfobulbaceae bacterium]|nr:hypothetical protein [Desulfobulbaceae bacterium]